MKIHLGCGNVRIPGFINIDLTQSEAVDLQSDIRYLSSFSPNSVDLIYACNVLEHFKLYEIRAVLKRWRSLLKDDGILRVSVPDLEALFKYYVKTKDLNGIYPSLFSCQGKPFSFHYWGWDFKTLKSDLEEIGFKNIRKYDRTKTEHANVRDWSTNFIPRFDKKGYVLPDRKWFKGINIALNVEASK